MILGNHIANRQKQEHHCLENPFSLRNSFLLITFDDNFKKRKNLLVLESKLKSWKMSSARAEMPEIYSSKHDASHFFISFYPFCCCTIPF